MHAGFNIVLCLWTRRGGAGAGVWKEVCVPYLPRGTQIEGGSQVDRLPFGAAVVLFFFNIVCVKYLSGLPSRSSGSVRAGRP